MIINTKIFLFIIFFCFVPSFFEKDIALSPGESHTEKLSHNDTIKVIFDKEMKEYKEFIKVVLESSSNINPLIIISKDDPTCSTNRLYSGAQSSESTYYFIKKEQIFHNKENSSFYICFIASTNVKEYSIIIKNEDKANLPINSQTSYLVYENNTKMNFNLLFDQSISSNPNHINIWAKGQNITNVTLKINGNQIYGIHFEYGFIFSVDSSNKNEEYTLEIEAQNEDFITIGSIPYENSKAFELKENAKEIIAMKDNKQNEICFPIKFPQNYILNINGKIYTRKALIYYKNTNLEIIPNTKYNITNGILSSLNSKNLGQNIGDEGYFCISNLESHTETIIFSIQMTSNREISLIHPPMIKGEIRRHILLEGEFAAFYGLNPKKTAKEVNLNLKALKGFPEMYFNECNDFPKCHYNNNSFKREERIFPSNRMSVYSFYIEEKSEDNIDYKNYNPFSKFQPLMVVYCFKGGKDEKMGENSVCEFDTSYFTDEDTINIYENNAFSQYLLEGERDRYKINIENEKDLDKVYIDMIAFSGNPDLRVHRNRTGQRPNRYFLGNKMYYSVKVTPELKEIRFDVRANKTSFYMVQCQLIKKENDSQYLNVIESGVNFISSVKKENYESSKEEKKIFELINYKSEIKSPYLITFYSQNCRFYSYRITSNGTKEDIVKMEDYGQMIIESKQEDYVGNSFKVGLEITSTDFSQVQLKNYMIYISGLELSENMKEWNERSISLSEGIPHRYTFTKKYPFISYAYHMSEYIHTLILNFQFKDKGTFKVDIYVGKYYLKNETIYRDGNIYIKPNEFLGKCEDQEVCTVIAFIEMVDKEKDKLLEFSMYQIDGNPIYLEKNVIKKDIINGNKIKHYYFDIDDAEYGDITLDFKRGSGKIYASIQEKEGRRRRYNTTDWRGMFKFPTSNDESLKYATYNKKIIISKNSTSKCKEGCYVLISVSSNLFVDQGFEDDFTPYRISINPRIINSIDDSASANPKVKIDINEFIIGDINLEFTPNIKYDYYEVTFKQDSDYIFIDWQADSPSFIINYGRLRPERSDYTSIHYNGSKIGDYVYIIPKTDILEKLNSTENTLENLTMTIGIFSDNMDSIYSSPYAFKIYMSPKDQDIIHIRSDQKVQCLTYDLKEKNAYICYFAVVFDEMDIGSNLIAYPKSQKGEELTIYGGLFNSENIEKNDISTVKSYFNEMYNNQKYKINKKYIYVKNIQKGQSFLFMTVLKDSDIVEVFSSTYYYYENMIVYPNPSSPQIFAIGNKKIRLNFSNFEDLLLNIVSISEEGYFNWEIKDQKDLIKNYLKGFEDRLSLTTYTADANLKSSLLQVNSNELKLKEENNDTSGFIFYITYYPRSSKFTMDQIKQGRNFEINYRTVNMPLRYFAPMNEINSWFACFNFYDFNIQNNNIISYENKLFNIWGTVITEEEALLARKDSKFIPKYDEKNSIKGTFDLAFGSISIDAGSVSPKKNPYIYFTVENKENSNLNFINMNLELGFFSDYVNKGFMQSIPENFYLTGKISNTEMKDNFIYKLNYDSNNPYLRIEYSSDTDDLLWSLSTTYNSEKSDNFNDMKKTTNNGRNLWSVKLDESFFNSKPMLFLRVFTKKKIDSRLGNFVFKYMNTKETSEIFYYSIPKSQITLKNETVDGKVNYNISFYPIENNDVTYFIKAVYNRKKIEGEKIDTIAISEFLGKNMQITNPKYEKDKLLTFTLQDVKKKINHIKVMAKVTIKTQKVYLLYTPLNVEEWGEEGDIKPSDEDTKQREKTKTWVYVVSILGSIIVLAVIIVIVIIIVYKYRNRDLLKTVNKVSFIGDKDKDQVDENLLVDENNLE